MTEVLASDEQLESIHPLAIGLIALLGEGREKPEEIYFGPELARDLKTELGRLVGSEQLRWALSSLLDLVNSLEHAGSKTAAQALLEALETPEIAQAVEALNQLRAAEESEAAASGAERFAKMTGSSGAKQAPKVGDETPADAVTLDELGFPKYI